MLLGKLARAAVFCIVLVNFGAPAQTQEAAPPPPTSTEPAQPATPVSAPPTPENRPALQEEVVVTGSRIRRKDLTTPAPVTVVSRQQIENSGRMTIGDFLQIMPEQGNAPNFQVNTGGINYGTDSSTRINLRSLGVQRTLVLLNGRRMVPSGLGASAAPDLNNIPSEAVERIEILKDGASAIYGSDAIAGVVNVITRRNYNGVDLGAQYGVSGHGDAQTFDAHVTGGSSDETKSALFSVRYMKQYDSWLRDRDWSKQAFDYDFTGSGPSFSGSSRVPQGDFRIPELGSSKKPDCRGNAFCLALTANGNWSTRKRYIRDPVTHIACGQSVADLAAGTQQCYRDFNTVAPSNDPPNSGNDFYNFAAQNYLTIPSQTIQAFSNGDLKWSNVRGYYEASYTQRSANQNAAPMPLNPSDYADIFISKDNVYNPVGTDIVYLGRRMVEFGRRGYAEDLGTFHVVTGLEGNAPPSFGPLQGWYWDASVNYGRTTGTFTTTGSFRNSRIRNALGPSMIINGQPVCVQQAGNPNTVIPGCVPLNLFGGPGTIDANQTAYLSYTGTSRAFDELFTVGATVGGDLFSIAAERPVSLALGYEFRRQNGAQIADPVAAERDSADFDFGSTNGYFYANEAFAELVAPIFANVRGVEELEAQAALRYANYNTFGGKATYKLGLRYTPIRDVTVRGTYSTGFRAPNITETYGGGFEFDPAAIDPCSDFTGLDPAVVARCKATGVTGSGSGDTNGQEIDRNIGNRNLQAETSKNFTAGIVVQPTMVRGLSVTVDYYNVSIDNAIQVPGAPYILQGCYLNGIQQFCDQIVRNKFGLISYVNDPFTNFGNRSTAGVDFAVRYSLPTTVGRFTIGWEGNYLAYMDQHLNIPNFPTLVTHSAGTFDGILGAMPKVKSNLGLDWSSGGALLGVLGRYVASMDECSNTSDPTTAFGGQCGYITPAPDGTTTNPFRRRVKSYVQVDLHAAYTLASSAGRTTVIAGINNVLDQAPPYIYSAALANSDPQTYDFLGRYVYGRVQHRF